MSKQSQIREEITAKIIAALERDILPWRRPWIANGPGRHTNVVSGKPYSGVNPLLLQIHAAAHCFSSQWWGTFNQWKTLGCMVNRRPDDVEPGQWGCGIVVYIPVTKEIEDPETGEEEEETYWLLRKFVLFNAQQVSGAAAEQYQAVKLPETTATPDYAPAEELIAKSGADIRYGGNQAFYRLPCPEGSWPNHRGGDFIQLPPKSAFVNGAFYSTALHELAHWSEVRVGWDREKGGYPMGELIAEMGACFLATELGVPNDEPLANHAAYIKNWLQAMRDNPNFIFQASRQASKVCDFLLSFVKQDATEPKPELVGAD